MLPASIHICASNDHVPKIERSVRMIKERTRTMCHSILYNRYIRLMTESLACTVVQCLNDFPRVTGVLGNYIPANIIEGKLNPDFNRQKLHFESYALAYHRINNNMTGRATPVVALCESNDFDGYYSMSLKTGKRLHARKLTSLPIDQDIIDKV